MTAEQLKRWREKRRWTQQQAAEWWGVTGRQWQRYESGMNPVPEPLAKRVKDPTHDFRYLVGTPPTN